MKRKVDIGLDIGIASVGWALVDAETSEIIKHGVRLFDPMDDKKTGELENAVRREKRSARRQVNRRKTLKRDFVKFLIEQKFVTDIKFSHEDKQNQFVNEFRAKYINNPQVRQEIDSEAIKMRALGRIDQSSVFSTAHANGLGTFYLRKLGMKEALTNVQFINVLYWYILHRGFKYEVVETTDSKKTDEKMKGTFNEATDKKAFPVDTQLTYYEKNQFLNGTLNRIFRNTDYEAEIRQIWANQNYSTQLLDEFLSLFKRQRSFEVGPGSSAAPSRYGLWVYDFDANGNKKPNPNYKGPGSHANPFLTRKRYETIWEKTVGKCSVYPTENRAPKNSASAEIFNLLNDLNNLSIGQEKLTAEQKQTLVAASLTVKSNANTIVKSIIKMYNLSRAEEISGSRIDKSKAMLFTELLSINTIAKLLGRDANYGDFFTSKGQFIETNIYDQIAQVLNKSTVVETREEALRKLLPDLTLELIKKLANVKLSFAGNHSLSFKALHEMLPILMVEPLNQMEYLNKYFKPLEVSDEAKVFSNNWIDDVIVTPTVKQALREALKILKALFDLIAKNDYELVDIVIEMTCETKSKSAKEFEAERQKYYEQMNNQIRAYIQDFEARASNTKSVNRTREKLWLLLQQKRRDAYTGDVIEPDEVIANPGAFDIDHILPESQTFDNSRENKVLTRQQSNQAKGNKTPKQFLSDQQFARMEKFWKNWYLDVPADQKVFKSQLKYDMLTTTLDMSLAENQIGFIGRNLVDTSYTTKALLDYLTRLSKIGNYGFKVKTINGKMTSFARRNLENAEQKLNRPENCGDHYDEKKKKNRIWNGHHAEDAYLVTVLNRNYRNNKVVEKIISNPHNRYVKLQTDKSFTPESKAFLNSDYPKLMASFDHAREELNDKMDKVTFTRKIITKRNLGLFNETLYAGRTVASLSTSKSSASENLLQKISTINLVESEAADLAKYFDPKTEKSKADNVLLKKASPTRWQDLVAVFAAYKGEKKPFAKAYEDAKALGGKFVSPSREQLNPIFTKKIKVKLETKEVGEIVFAKDAPSSKSFYDSLNWAEIRVYKNRSDKNVLVPINASNASFINNTIEVNKVALASQLQDWNVPINAKFLRLKYGDVIKKENGELMYISGHFAKFSKIELKYLHRQLLPTEPKQLHLTINTALSGSHLVKRDILGENAKFFELF